MSRLPGGNVSQQDRPLKASRRDLLIRIRALERLLVKNAATRLQYRQELTNAEVEIDARIADLTQKADADHAKGKPDDANRKIRQIESLSADD